MTAAVCLSVAIVAYYNRRASDGYRHAITRDGVSSFLETHHVTPLHKGMCNYLRGERELRVPFEHLLFRQGRNSHPLYHSKREKNRLSKHDRSISDIY